MLRNHADLRAQGLDAVRRQIQIDAFSPEFPTVINGKERPAGSVRKAIVGGQATALIEVSR